MKTKIIFIYFLFDILLLEKCLRMKKEFHLERTLNNRQDIIYKHWFEIIFYFYPYYKVITLRFRMSANM